MRACQETGGFLRLCRAADGARARLFAAMVHSFGEKSSWQTGAARV